MNMEATIALAGNPNSGKTTIFNELTGARQHVGNYPGVTVEKKEGTYRHNGYQANIVDLPGTYSLTAYSLEELVARDYLVNERPDVVIDIIDASNLERNMYLLVQFLEMGIPVCVALNMMDMAQHRGIEIDVKKLETLLGVPVIPTVARKGQGKNQLMASAMKVAVNAGAQRALEISYGEDIDNAIRVMEAKIQEHHFMTDRCFPRWIALKYLEQDQQIVEQGRAINSEVSLWLEDRVSKLTSHLQATLGLNPEDLIADFRYGFIRSIVRNGVVQYKQDVNRLALSDKIDQVLTHRLAGPLVMALVLLGLYKFTFSVGEIPAGWLENGFGWIRGLVSAHMTEGMLKSLVISGIIDGVGGVLGFVPLIMLMFMGVAILEDSGYLARVAFMLDRVFRIFGLHGSSVMAYVVSGGIAGGCAVPGIMAARTIKSRRERLATILTAPFMNCGAKLPVFALLIAAFFAHSKAWIMFWLTIGSWAGSLLVAKLLRTTVIKGEPSPFVMELPPYRLPTLKGIAIHTWERTWQYIRKAGTVILAISILLWAMMTFPQLSQQETAVFEQQRQAVLATYPPSVVAEYQANSEADNLSENALVLKNAIHQIDTQEAQARLGNSIAGRMGTALESITRVAGFDWRTNIALVGGFAAKEVVVSALGTAYSLGDVDPEESKPLSQTLANSPQWSPAVALALIVFIAFYSPCFVSVVCIARESGSWKWGLFSMVFNSALALSLAAVTYQVARLFF